MKQRSLRAFQSSQASPVLGSTCQPFRSISLLWSSCCAASYQGSVRGEKSSTFSKKICSGTCSQVPEEAGSELRSMPARLPKSLKICNHRTPLPMLKYGRFLRPLIQRTISNCYHRYSFRMLFSAQQANAYLNESLCHCVAFSRGAIERKAKLGSNSDKKTSNGRQLYTPPRERPMTTSRSGRLLLSMASLVAHQANTQISQQRKRNHHYKNCNPEVRHEGNQDRQKYSCSRAAKPKHRLSFAGSAPAAGTTPAPQKEGTPSPSAQPRASIA